MTRVIQIFLKTHTFMESNLEIYQSIRTFMIPKSMEVGKRKYFERCTWSIAENGFSKKFYRDLPDYSGMSFEKSGREEGFVHYSGLQNYIEANTRVEALRYDKLDYLFRVYFAVVTAMLLVNLACYVVNNIFRMFKKHTLHSIMHRILYCIIYSYQLLVSSLVKAGHRLRWLAVRVV